MPYLTCREAGMMACHDFRAFRPVPAREDRDESMHFAVQPQVGGYFRVRLERATQVVDGNCVVAAINRLASSDGNLRESHGSFRSFRQP